MDIFKYFTFSVFNSITHDCRSACHSNVRVCMLADGKFPNRLRSLSIFRLKMLRLVSTRPIFSGVSHWNRIVTPLVEWFFISFMAMCADPRMAMSSADKHNCRLHNKLSAAGSLPDITEVAATYCNLHWKLAECQECELAYFSSLSWRLSG